MANNLCSLKNKLNNLTGSEWKYSTKSVINKNYSINIQHKLRSEHGGQKPPELCSDLIKIFTKENQKVLDPFMGVGGTLLGAALINREGLGIDLNLKWIEIYKKVCELEKIKELQTLCGDSLEILETLENESFDFILTDVPYWNMDTQNKTRNKKIKQSKLSNFQNVTENQSKKEWLDLMKSILEKSVKKLKKGKYLAVFIGDMYRESEYHMLSGELAIKLSEISGLKMKANIIWQDNSKSLHIFGYPAAYVPSLIHQNILIFRKE
ncbi:class I SAM-dependent methyltransferase [Streptobacillus canis]|uniref:class I SAM-dependent methyltransferase n=1 Tax=Streptobacillus canis TaxID=2678686 RepID=UPI0012E1094A|nr:class I SAM-dependent methyltransferase [Streptobacillus canis]